MVNTIDNDAYLILVYKDFDNIIVSKDSYKEISYMKDALNIATSNTKVSTGEKLLKVLSAGVTSSIAQSMTSKVGLPNSVKGRIQSSLYDIISDGKVSKLEIAEDFIGSCTNELDSVAIDLGFPTATSLYQAIGPDGAGVISQDFISKFQKQADKRAGEILAQKNKVAQDLTVLKFKLVVSESESWATNLPTRKTQKGFNIVEAIENENDTKEFEISIVNNNNGVEDMYGYREQLYDIRNKKIPFDIYINDPYNKKQLAWTHCFFTGLNMEPDGINSLKLQMSITKIPEWDIKTEHVSAIGSSNVSRKQSKASSSRQKSIKTAKKKKDIGAYPIKKDVVSDVNNIIYKTNSGKYSSQSEVDKLFKMYTGYNASKFNVYYNRTNNVPFYYNQQTNTVRRG